MRIVMTRGLPASGKSTWAKEYIEYHDEPWYRWNNDEFCAMMTGKMFAQVDGRFLSRQRKSFIVSAVRAEASIILDNTNLNPYTTIEVEEVLNTLEYKPCVEIQDIYFPISLEDAIERDAAREHSVGAKVITQMHDRWIDKWPQLKVD